MPPKATRRKPTNAQLAEFDAMLLQIIAGQDGPQSVRHIFYRATDPRWGDAAVPKEEDAYKRVARRLGKLRREGRVSYGAIADTSRRAYWYDGFQNMNDFAWHVSQLYRKDIWHQLGVQVEVWCESRSLSGVLDPLCEELGVPLFPSGGFASLSFLHEAAEHIARNRAQGGKSKPALLLYAGDYDPSGVLIDTAIERDLRQFLTDLRYTEQMDFVRLAVTPQQIADWQLPTKPRKKGDKRRPDIERTVEAESIPADQLRQLFRDAIEQMVPRQHLDAVRLAERSERQDILRALTPNPEHTPAGLYRAGTPPLRGLDHSGDGNDIARWQAFAAAKPLALELYRAGTDPWVIAAKCLVPVDDARALIAWAWQHEERTDNGSACRDVCDCDGVFRTFI